MTTIFEASQTHKCTKRINKEQEKDQKGVKEDDKSQPFDIRTCGIWSIKPANNIHMFWIGIRIRIWIRIELDWIIHFGIKIE